MHVKNFQDAMADTNSFLWHAEVFRYSQMAQRYSYTFLFVLELDKVFHLISISPRLAIAEGVCQFSARCPRLMHS